MSDFHDMAESALLHDLRAEQVQAQERRAFADALEQYAQQEKGNKSEQ